jgi:hypothetical protein
VSIGVKHEFTWESHDIKQLDDVFLMNLLQDIDFPHGSDWELATHQEGGLFKYLK